MSPWVTAVLFATLVATVPMAWVLRVMQDLPDPLVSSHRRWPGWANAALIGVVTAVVAAFIRFAYYGVARDPVGIAFQFLIACVVYVFGMVLLLRQFAGLYPEYFVTTGRTGLRIRKAVYAHVASVETVAETRSETSLRIEMVSGEFLSLDLPKGKVARLHEAIEASKPEP